MWADPSCDASSLVQYTYDVLGRRTSRIESEISNPQSAITNLFVYNGNQISADLDGDGNLIRSYTWGPGIDNLLAMTTYTPTETNTYYALKDHQNSVLAFTDATGTVVESYEYDAWGNPRIFDAAGSEISNGISQIGNRYLFQGREYDWTTGLYYFRARWYNPETGRWLSKDPIGISGGLNLYAFCGNNPVNFIDPFGLCRDDLNLWDANRHYRDGNGTPIYVDANSIRITGVNSSDFNGVGGRMTYRTKIFSEGGDFFVYGNITLEYAGDNQVNILPDNYGFEMHEGRPFRNAETVIGGAIAGDGTPYDINFEGSVPIDP